MTGQVDELLEAFTHLQASIPDNDQVRLVYGSLVAKAFREPNRYGFSWLVTEIRFEAFAASTQNRDWAAQMDLTLGRGGHQEVRLALYQERLTRVF